MDDTNKRKVKILISDNRKIDAVQKEFNCHFPYLKIEFFSRPHKIGNGSSKKLLKPATQTIGRCRTARIKGHISITSVMSAAELEQKFREKYGLNIKLFRKSGSVWLEITVTDSWTLDQQNKQGEALSNLVSPEFTRSVFTGPRK
jgi:hypothetical protein